MKKNVSKLGLDFEDDIRTYCDMYKSQGNAFIEKLEIPKTFAKGKAIYKKKSPFDFVGAATPGIAIAFECKSKKSAIAKTAKFRLITRQEEAIAKLNKKSRFSSSLGIMPHQIDSLYKWVANIKGCGFFFFRVYQTSKKLENRYYYGIVIGDTLYKIWNEWDNNKRNSILFSECDIILENADFLPYIIHRHTSRGL